MARSSDSIPIDPPYDKDLCEILSFKSLHEAEETLLRLEDLRQKYRAKNDDKGVEYCRQVAMLGRRRAQLISRNRRVQPLKRRQKEEIALWFQIWLETPELFPSWLDLRKSASSFNELRGSGEEG